MMYKKLRVLIPLFIFLMLILCNFNGVVAESYWTFDFNEFNDGDESGSTSFFSFEESGMGADDVFELTTRADFDGLCLEYQGDDSAVDNNFDWYINFSNMDVKDFSIKMDVSASVMHNDTLYFYDENDVVILRLHFFIDGATAGGNAEISYYEYGIGCNDLRSYTINDQTFFYLNLSYINNTYFNYKWDNGSSTNNEDGLIAGYSFNGISYIRCVTDETNPAHTYYFDDIVVSEYSSGVYDSCEGSYYVLIKNFDDSIAYTNQTVQFEWYAKADVSGSYIITNSTGVTVQNGYLNGQHDFIPFQPDYYEGVGDYYIRLKPNIVQTYDVNCLFTVSASAAVGDWYVSWNKSSYKIYESVSIDYKIPSGQYGNFSILEIGGTFLDGVPNNVLGTGNMENMLLFPSDSEGCFNLYLYNASNSNLMFPPSYMCVEGGMFEYTLFVNGENNCSVNVNDTVTISGRYSGNNDDLFIKIYDVNDPDDDSDRVGLIPLGSDDAQIFYESWLANINESVGVENFYVYIGSIEEYGTYLDRYCIISVYDDEVVIRPDPITPLPTGSEDWVMPIAFMVCLVVGGFLYFITSSGVMGGVGVLGALMFFSTPGHPFNWFPPVYLFIIGLLIVVIAIYMLRS